MKIQLQKSLIKIKYTENLDLTWALKNIKPIINQHIDGEYIAIFPFSSEKHKNKIWPYFPDLIKEIKSIFGETWFPNKAKPFLFKCDDICAGPVSLDTI